MKGPFRPGWYRRVTDGATIVHKVVGHPTGEDGKSWLTCPFDAAQGGPCGNGKVLTPEAWQSFEPATPPRVAIN